MERAMMFELVMEVTHTVDKQLHGKERWLQRKRKGNLEFYKNYT